MLKGSLRHNQQLMSFLVVLLVVIMTTALMTRIVIVRHEKGFAKVDKRLVISVAVSILLWDVFALASVILN
jgi:hypothetical protein